MNLSDAQTFRFKDEKKFTLRRFLEDELNTGSSERREPTAESIRSKRKVRSVSTYVSPLIILLEKGTETSEPGGKVRSGLKCTVSWLKLSIPLKGRGCL